ncbi:MAG: TonB-dependent receptor plug domain-containing protein [Nitrospirota bacterium]
MKDLICLCLSVVTLTSLCLPIKAFSTENLVPLEEIIVTATRLSEFVGESTSDVTVITGEDIEKMNVRFLPEVLRTVSELNVVQNGTTGTVATVLLRGGDSTHTLILLDGIRVNSTTTGSFDFSGISADDIERIEIVKGPQSTLYGSEAMAGVINILTKKGRGKVRGELSLEAGSFGNYSPSATISGGQDRVHYRLTASHFSTDGISSARTGQERDGYRNSVVSGKFGIALSDAVELEMTGRYAYDRTELDGFDFLSMLPSDDENFVQRRNVLLMSGKGRIMLLPGLEAVFTLATSRESLGFRDPDTEFNNYRIETRMDTIDWQNNVFCSEAYTVTAGAELRNETGENKDNFDESLTNRALYLNNTIRLFSRDLVLNAGLRYDDHETSGSETTCRIGALYSYKPLSIRLRSSYGTGFRAPTLNELFFPFYGNLNLKAEKSTSWEIGIEKDIIPGSLMVSLAYFDQKYKNLIQTDPVTWSAANIAEAKIRGVETEVSASLTEHLSVHAGYTCLDTEDKTTGHALTRRPEDKITVSSQFSNEKISMVLRYIFIGKRYDASVDRHLPSYSLIGLSGSYQADDRLTFFGRIENLFDAEYEEAGGYNTPGFSVSGGMRVSL